MVQVTTKKSFARVRDELMVITSYYAALDVKYAYVLRLCILWQECLTGNELTRKELFRACFSKDTGLQKMLKLQMQLMERDDDAWWLEAIRFHFISCCCIFGYYICILNILYLHFGYRNCNGSCYCDATHFVAVEQVLCILATHFLSSSYYNCYGTCTLHFIASVFAFWPLSIRSRRRSHRLLEVSYR